MCLEPVLFCSLTQPPPARPPHGPVPTVRVLLNTKKMKFSLWPGLSSTGCVGAGWASGLAGHLWAARAWSAWSHSRYLFIFWQFTLIPSAQWLSWRGCYSCRFTIVLPRETKCDEAHVRCDEFCIENNFVSWYLVLLQILFIFNVLTWFVKSDSFSICPPWRVFWVNVIFWVKYLFTQFQWDNLGSVALSKVNIHFVSIRPFLSNIFPWKVNFGHGGAFVDSWEIYILMQIQPWSVSPLTIPAMAAPNAK